MAFFKYYDTRGTKMLLYGIIYTLVYFSYFWSNLGYAALYSCALSVNIGPLIPKQPNYKSFSKTKAYKSEYLQEYTV